MVEPLSVRRATSMEQIQKVVDKRAFADNPNHNNRFYRGKTNPAILTVPIHSYRIGGHVTSECGSAPLKRKLRARRSSIPRCSPPDVLLRGVPAESIY